MNHGRLPWMHPDDLDEQQRELYEEILGGPRGAGPQSFPLTDDQGRLVGPFNGMLVDPPVGQAAQRLGVALRFESALEPRSREIAILQVATVYQSEFEWFVHVAVGRAIGLRDEELAALKEEVDYPTFSDDERIVREVVIALLKNRDLDTTLYGRATDRLGIRVVFDLVALVGFYEYTALALRVFRVPLPDGVVDSFTDEHEPS